MNGYLETRAPGFRIISIHFSSQLQHKMEIHLTAKLSDILPELKTLPERTLNLSCLSV